MDEIAAPHEFFSNRWGWRSAQKKETPKCQCGVVPGWIRGALVDIVGGIGLGVDGGTPFFRA